MANHKSALKRHRQSLKRRDANRGEKTHVRTLTKRIRSLVEEGDLEGAKAILPQAEKKIAQASAKGIYHWANAARKISRLNKLVAKANSL
jgi:small subunit ribosomal protein S20